MPFWSPDECLALNSIFRKLIYQLKINKCNFRSLYWTLFVYKHCPSNPGVTFKNCFCENICSHTRKTKNVSVINNFIRQHAFVLFLSAIEFFSVVEKRKKKVFKVFFCEFLWFFSRSWILVVNGRTSTFLFYLYKVKFISIFFWDSVAFGWWSSWANIRTRYWLFILCPLELWSNKQTSKKKSYAWNNIWQTWMSQNRNKNRPWYNRSI